MIKNKDSLKAKASNLSKETNIPNKYIIQEFMFEALLRRISIYKDHVLINNKYYKNCRECILNPIGYWFTNIMMKN